MDKAWYVVDNVANLDSPSLLVYKNRVAQNLQKMRNQVANVTYLMPHVKTNKMPAITQMMLDLGIDKFKCATIAEAEMIARAGGKYILIAHQLVGPKMPRLARLQEAYPEVFFASLIDNKDTLFELQKAFQERDKLGHIFLDVDNGMHRSGIAPGEALLALYQLASEQANIKIYGLHVYDGHIRDNDFTLRKEKIQQDFSDIPHWVTQIKNRLADYLQEHSFMLIAGGSPAFTTHAQEEEVYCSPGTAVLWDWGYGDTLEEQDFDWAALVLSRIISKPKEGIITLDLGHKSVAAENPIDKRIRFLNLGTYELKSQSEEHGVVQVPIDLWKQLKVGQELYGVPYHVCPTVNLYDEAYVIADHRQQEVWEVLGRKRRIEI
ncbi:MAG: D-TA family PLP-dependent enzyme [Bacteroidota bacterium]